MKTTEVKTGTIEDILAYAEEHKYYPSGEQLRKEIEQYIREGQNYMHVKLTESIPCGIGYSVEDRSIDVILVNFAKEHLRVTTSDSDDPVLRRGRMDALERVIRMEREAEKRDAEFVQTMLANKEKIESAANRELTYGMRCWCGLESIVK